MLNLMRTVQSQCRWLLKLKDKEACLLCAAEPAWKLNVRPKLHVRKSKMVSTACTTRNSRPWTRDWRAFTGVSRPMEYKPSSCSSPENALISLTLPLRDRLHPERRGTARWADRGGAPRCPTSRNSSAVAVADTRVRALRETCCANFSEKKKSNNFVDADAGTKLQLPIPTDCSALCAPTRHQTEDLTLTKQNGTRQGFYLPDRSQYLSISFFLTVIFWQCGGGSMILTLQWNWITSTSWHNILTSFLTLICVQVTFSCGGTYICDFFLMFHLKIVIMLGFAFCFGKSSNASKCRAKDFLEVHGKAWFVSDWKLENTERGVQRFHHGQNQVWFWHKKVQIRGWEHLQQTSQWSTENSENRGIHFTHLWASWGWFSIKFESLGSEDWLVQACDCAYIIKKALKMSRCAAKFIHVELT